MSTPTAIRPELPELPRHMRGLPLDHRGYPVPWFAAWRDEEGKETPRGEGTPEIRCMGAHAAAEAHRDRKCWTCGGRLGRYTAFVVGPMCTVNRISAEPPSHVECADYAGRACPFLTRPHARRRDNDLPDDVSDSVPGKMIRRNPGVACVWISTQRYRLMPASNGALFGLPEPDEVRWYAEGRPATIEEIEHSIETGLPELHGLAQTEREHEEIELLAQVVRDRFLPAAA